MASEDQIALFNLGGEAQPTVSPEEVDRDRLLVDVKLPILPGTYADIEDLRQHCSQCYRCRLSQSRTHVVAGEGNPQASVMIVGEGPGQVEDETGRPFVGRSGELLNKILASVNLSREQDVFICNIVKCRPPENRTPATDEAEACKGYLLEQIRLVEPKIILLTGATALKGLLGIKQGITKVRGQWIEQDGRWYMPIFHPAYLLRNQSREKGSPKWLMWQDMQTVRAKLNELLGE
jgi:DNA polymerase